MVAHVRKPHLREKGDDIGGMQPCHKKHPSYIPMERLPPDGG